MPNFKANIIGGEQVRAALAKYTGERVGQAVGAALYMSASRVLTQAIINAPIDTGTLRASGYCTMPSGEGVAQSLTIGFGGFAKAYAAAQHDREDYKHREGGALYLKRALNQYGPTLPAMWAVEFAKALERPPGPPPQLANTDPYQGGKAAIKTRKAAQKQAAKARRKARAKAKAAKLRAHKKAVKARAKARKQARKQLKRQAAKRVRQAKSAAAARKRLGARIRRTKRGRKR